MAPSEDHMVTKAARTLPKLETTEALYTSLKHSMAAVSSERKAKPTMSFITNCALVQPGVVVVYELFQLQQHCLRGLLGLAKLHLAHVLLLELLLEVLALGMEALVSFPKTTHSFWAPAVTICVFWDFRV
jgi:hypothetical protein